MTTTETTDQVKETDQTQEQADDFQTGNVLTIAGGHFVHDTYTAFIAPLLPEIIDKFSLTLTAAGTLTAFMQFPAILNPFIGYLADKISLRYFVIFAPAVTATLIGLLGLAPSYLILVAIFTLIGISVAAFHAPTPAMIARISGKKIGRGMSLFMGGGELGRTLGPLIAVYAAGLWGLAGIYRLIFIGWLSSLVLLWRFRKASSSQYRQKAGNIRAALPKLRTFFLPMLLIVIARSFMNVSITTYLPTFLTFQGISLKTAGIALSVLEAAGVVGALTSGTISDRLGRKPVLYTAFAVSPVLLFIFLQAGGWFIFAVLLVLGFFSIAPQPVLLAMVQDHLPNNRAAANGLYMSMTFLVRMVVLVLVGMIGDKIGLHATFMISAAVSLVAIPGIMTLPKADN